MLHLEWNHEMQKEKHMFIYNNGVRVTFDDRGAP
jgi:hypothetical protein